MADLERVPLTKFSHEDPERHFIGESLAAPSRIESGTGAASVGTSPIGAREDHNHGSALLDPAVPKGLIWYERKPGDSTGLTSGATLWTLTTPVTGQVANRRYRYLWELFVQTSVAGPIWRIGVADVAAGNYHKWWGYTGTSGYDTVNIGLMTESSLPISAYPRLDVLNVTGGGTINCYGQGLNPNASMAASTRYSSFSIEDMGPI